MKKKRMTMEDMAMAAMKKAVRQVVLRHKKTGRPLAIWKDGKTVLISPDKIK
jgi:hypothetical protein